MQLVESNASGAPACTDSCVGREEPHIICGFETLHHWHIQYIRTTKLTREYVLVFRCLFSQGNT